jgi:hypothetical protein
VNWEAEKERWRNAGLAAALTVILPLLLAFTAGRLRRSFGPRDPAVLLWWPEEMTSLIAFAIAASIVVGLGTGIVVLGCRTTAWWKVSLWPWAVMGLVMLAAVAASARAEVRVYADRIVISDEHGARDTLPMASAISVGVWCDVISRKRKADVATLDYAIHFPDRSVSLRPALGSVSRDAARIWFHKVEELDREVLSALPHQSAGSAGHDVGCIRALRRELGEPDFTAARRMLGLTEADLARYYAEPHEAWSRDPAPSR